ncbi:MAG: hypothetical protein QOE08_1066, partial [Thermoleophilaceae bacterium]|nr:hypothetical protein [Thermoleophilaceae bacterium]
AAVYKVSGGRLMAVRLAQAALGVVTVALIGILAMLLFGRAAGLAALAIAAIYPGFLLMDDAIMSETLYVPLTLGAVVAACMHRRSPHRWRWAVVAGLIFGLSLLTRQNGVLLLVPLILLVWSKPGADRRQRLATAALVVLVAGLVVLPWTVRNAVKLDAFVPVATQSGLVLAGTYNDQSRNDPDLPGAWRPPNAVPRYADVFRDKSLNEAGVDAELRSRALSYISDHPGYLVAVGWHNVWRLMHLGGSRYERDQAGDRNVTQGEETVGRFGFYVLALMAIAGAATGLARRAPWYLWLVPVLLATVLLGQGMIRYRDPIDPFLVLLAACGVASLAVRGHATSGAAPAPPAASGRAP